MESSRLLLNSVLLAMLCFPAIVHGQPMLSEENQELMQTLNKLTETDPEEAEVKAKSLLQLALQTHDKLLEAHTRHVYGIALKKLGHYRSALIQVEQAEEHFHALGNRKEEADTLNTLGLLHSQLGDYVVSLREHLRALKIREEIGDKKGLAFSYNNLGNAYRNTGDLPKSLEYHFRAVELKKELGLKESLSYSYNNIGHSYRKMGDYEKAQEFFEKALQIRRELDSKSGIASSLNNLGTVLEAKGDLKGALVKYKKSLELRKELKNQWGVAGSYNNIGNILRQLGRFKDAVDYLEKGKSLGEEIDAAIIIDENYLYMARLYEDMGEMKTAMQYLRDYIKHHDAMFNLKNSKQLLAFQVEFETREKEIKADYYQALSEAESHAKDMQFRYFIFLVVLLSFVLVGLVHRYYFVTKSRSKLQSLSKDLADKSRQLADANAELEILARSDGLTGLINRRGFDEHLDKSWNLARRNSEPLSLLLIDVDLFKSYNDSFGHQEGDRALAKIGELLKQEAQRPEDSVCRYGGEEFAIIMGNTTLSGARIVAENIRETVENEQIEAAAESPFDYLTISIGGHTIIPDGNKNKGDFLSHADQALYLAKRNGRNQVRFFEETQHDPIT